MSKKKRTAIIIVCIMITIPVGIYLYEITPDDIQHFRGIADRERTEGYAPGEAPGRYEFGKPVYIGFEGNTYEYIELSNLSIGRESDLFQKSQIASDVAINFTYIDGNVDYRNFTGNAMYHMFSDRLLEIMTTKQYAENNVEIANTERLITTVENIVVLGCTLFEEGSKAVVYVGCDSYLYSHIFPNEYFQEQNNFVGEDGYIYLKTYYELVWDEKQETYLVDHFWHYSGVEATATNNV